jgi:hypothetical protein
LARNTLRLAIGAAVVRGAGADLGDQRREGRADSEKLPVALVVVAGSPASQAPLPFRSKQTVAPAYVEAAVLAGEEAAAVSAKTGGVKRAPPTTPLTMDTEAKADVEHSASVLAIAAASSVGRGILISDCM